MAEPSVETLEAEIVKETKDDIVSEWKRVLEDNRALRRYIDRMLSMVIVAAPHILERQDGNA